MDLLKVIKERRSIRAFKPDPVPKETIEEILKLAVLAPSAINLQPWEFIVVTGEEKERLSHRLVKAYLEKQISCGPGNVKPLPKTFAKRGAHRQRDQQLKAGALVDGVEEFRGEMFGIGHD